MGVKKVLNLVLKLYYKFRYFYHPKIYFQLFFSDFLAAALRPRLLVTTSTLANLAPNLDRNYLILSRNVRKMCLKFGTILI